MANYMLISLLRSHYSIENYVFYATMYESLKRMKEKDEQLTLILSSNNMELEELFSAIAIPCNNFIANCFIASDEAEMGKGMGKICCRLVRTF